MLTCIDSGSLEYIKAMFERPAAYVPAGGVDERPAYLGWQHMFLPKESMNGRRIFLPANG